MLMSNSTCTQMQSHALTCTHMHSHTCTQRGHQRGHQRGDQGGDQRRSEAISINQHLSAAISSHQQHSALLSSNQQQSSPPRYARSPIRLWESRRRADHGSAVLSAAPPRRPRLHPHVVIAGDATRCNRRRRRRSPRLRRRLRRLRRLRRRRRRRPWRRLGARDGAHHDRRHRLPN